MSGPDFAWEQAPDAAMEAFDERLRLVEILLDPHIGNADKRAERRRYCEQHRVGERTIRGYLHRYRKKGPRGLLFYRPRPTSPRVHDPGLRAKLLALVNELPTRSVPQLRKLLATDDQLGSKWKPALIVTPPLGIFRDPGVGIQKDPRSIALLCGE